MDKEISFREMVVLVRVAIVERENAKDLNHPTYPPSEIEVIKAVKTFQWIQEAKGIFKGFFYDDIEKVLELVRELWELERVFRQGIETIIP